MSPEPEGISEVAYADKLGELKDGGEAPSEPISGMPSTEKVDSDFTLKEVDVTFEPTIDMLVNDFDDEQTLNEEEALAALEHQNPQDEIAKLREESEMPLEELLEKYRAMAEHPKKKAKRNGNGCNKKIKSKRNRNSNSIQVEGENENDDKEKERNEDLTVESVESADEEETSEEPIIGDEKHDTNAVSTPANDETEYESGSLASPIDEVKSRSHLLDLYPEGTFGMVGGGDGKAIPLEILYEEDDDIDYDVEDCDETGTDYARKSIMVGSNYQAVIPDGLSQYGDVLPYENEDKLIWEPRQVSEQQVEEYLLKVRDIKPTMLDDEGLSETAVTNEIFIKDVGNDLKGNVKMNESEPLKDVDVMVSSSNENKTLLSLSANEGEISGVVKDNEQALHLLVQCGYDFKEALRRKRLNAVPLTGSMSLWSEDECHKFEEGIQKFGKDFLKIRQNQVRTRTMRELVQFYYLWKKSDRRDHDFANSDTVDHMDIYLNESTDFNPNTSNTASSSGSSVTTASSVFGGRKTTASTQKNYLIMTTGNNISTNTGNQIQTTNNTPAKISGIRRRSNAAVIGTSMANSNSDSSQFT